MKKVIEENKHEIIELLNSNSFCHLFDLFVIVVLNKKIIFLTNKELNELYELSVKKLRLTKKGMSSKEFYKQKGDCVSGYRIFDSEKWKEYQEGEIITDITKHGMYFTIHENEVFRFILTNGFEGYGDSFAVISLRDRNGKPIKGAHIVKGGDTSGTFRSRKFLISRKKTLDDKELIKEQYEKASDNIKGLINVDDLYYEAVSYYKSKGMNNTVKALRDIRNQKEE